MPDSADASKRRILRSSSIMGGASVINVLLSVLRMKVAAVTLGPVGVGLIGLFQNFVLVAAAVGSLGIGSSAPRQIAIERAQRGEAGEAEARLVLAVGACVLSVLGALLVWVLRAPVAGRIFADPSLAPAAGWLALAVGLTVFANTQTGLLTGLQRIGDAARVNVLASVLTTIVAIAAFVLWRNAAAIVFVVASPLAAALVGLLYIRRLPRPVPTQLPAKAVFTRLRGFVSVGLAMTAAGLIGSSGPLVIRHLITDRMGLPELGLFQASWAIATTYLSIVLSAMSADYFPRLSANTADPQTFNLMINEQTEVALLLAGPIIVAAIGGAPILVHLLYGAQFEAAAGLLRWQMLGDVVKVASWPLGFALLAPQRTGTFIALELLTMLVFVGGTALLLPVSGLQAPGQAYVAMYIVYLPLVFLAARRATRVQWSRIVRVDFELALSAAIVVLAGGAISNIVGLALGVVAGALLAARSFRRLRHVIGPRLRPATGLRELDTDDTGSMSAGGQPS